MLLLFLFFQIFIYFPAGSEGTISSAFCEFLNKTYGRDAEQQIARWDLGEEGSFGGGGSRLKAKKRPVIFVHALTMTAGGLKPVLEVFFKKGKYQKSELYGTTFSNGVTNWTTDRIECRHVKQIRLLIKAVLDFTYSKQVDVIGYSFGSPMARKAILGGHCVDTGENLGSPLTNSVNTFIGVAGTNRDAVHACAAFPKTGPCNSLNGVKCHSKFLDNINSKSHGYEAKSRIYVIRSTTDDFVGTRDCDKKIASSIEGQHGEVVIHNFYTHFMTILLTGKQQLWLLGNYL